MRNLLNQIFSLLLTIQWKKVEFWNARNFAFLFNNQILARLAFTNFWNYSGTYSYQNTTLKFSEAGLWRQKIVIQQNHKVVALIEKEFFGDHILQLRSGERFKLISNIFGKNTRWVNQQGNVVMKYDQTSFNSIGNGNIHFTSGINEEVRNILTGSGLFIRQLLAKRSVYIIIFMVFLAIRKG